MALNLALSNELAMTFEIALVIVGALIGLVGIFALIVSVWLAVKYAKFNRVKNSAGLTGEMAARKVLDSNGLKHIKVSSTGSILFGNSYSRYLKKVRIRRFTRHKYSVTALGLGVQKAALAILDKEGDKDVNKRVRLYPLITFGPCAFIPLLLIGGLLDYYVFGQTGWPLIVFGAIGLLFYIYALVLSVLTLKTEKKAQNKAYEILKAENMATDEELGMLKELFHLYNVQYINDIILASLELLYTILQILMAFTGNGSTSSSSSSN